MVRQKRDKTGCIALKINKNLCITHEKMKKMK